MIYTHFPFIRSKQNHLARHSENEKKTRQIEEKVGKQQQRMVRPGFRQVPDGSGEQVPEGSGKQRKMEETVCGVICGVPTTFAVKG